MLWLETKNKKTRKGFLKTFNQDESGAFYRWWFGQWLAAFEQFVIWFAAPGSESAFVFLRPSHRLPVDSGPGKEGHASLPLERCFWIGRLFGSLLPYRSLCLAEGRAAAGRNRRSKRAWASCDMRFISPLKLSWSKDPSWGSDWRWSMRESSFTITCFSSLVIRSKAAISGEEEEEAMRDARWEGDGLSAMI